MQNAIKALTDGSAFSTQKTSVGDSTIIGASANTTAQPNDYNIVVSQLATVQKTTSAGFTDATSAAGTGSLTISIGGKSINLNVATGANSLQNIRDSINKSSDNPGVTASIVTGTDGAHLVLTSTATGAANAFTVTTSGGDGNLSKLDFDPATDTATTKAQDAAFTIDGTPATSTTNSVAGAIDGVTLTLSKVGSSSLTIANDPSAVWGPAEPGDLL